MSVADCNPSELAVSLNSPAWGGGLDDDLGETVEQATGPARGGGVPEDSHGHIRIQAALVRDIVDADGDDIVAGMNEFPDVEDGLGLTSRA
ncbi:MAG TPA: hypothetical protein VGY98_20800 [Verrucomicrobiae bacterium]|nr:hypothetical protein [Verrucomicrobiae bacterium]